MIAPSKLVEPLSHIEVKPVAWLWQHRLARGKLSIFDGDPELGKSFVTLDLCARITTGRPFPDGAPGAEPANVIVVSGEDSAEDTVAPRLQALGADLDRVFRFHQDHLDEKGAFLLPKGSESLEEAVAETRAVFVVIDPIVAFLDPAIQVWNDMSVRSALRPLADLCARHGCHTVMVRHLNKSGHFRSMYRGGGSIGILAACRSGYLFARDPQDPKKTVFAQIKNNLGARQGSLVYRVQAPDNGPATLEWLGECSLNADQLLAAAGLRPYLPSKLDRACDFLVAFLDEGPRTTLDVAQAGEEQGITLRTLQRASEKVKIKSKSIQVQNRRNTYWMLPHQDLPADVAPDVPSLEPWLAPIRAQFPSDPLAPDPP